MVDGRRMNVPLNEKFLEVVECYKYLGSHVGDVKWSLEWVK